MLFVFVTLKLVLVTSSSSLGDPSLSLHAFRFEIDETSPSMSGCCGDDCSYEILSRRTKHGEASAGHTHGGGHCGGCCHWSASAPPFYDWLKASNFHGCVWKLELPATAAGVLSLTGCRAPLKMNRWWNTWLQMSVSHYGLRFMVSFFFFRVCLLFGVFLLEKQYAVWAFTHSSFLCYFSVQCPSHLFSFTYPS